MPAADGEPARTPLCAIVRAIEGEEDARAVATARARARTSRTELLDGPLGADVSRADVEDDTPYVAERVVEHEPLSSRFAAPPQYARARNVQPISTSLRASS